MFRRIASALRGLAPQSDPQSAPPTGSPSPAPRPTDDQGLDALVREISPSDTMSGTYRGALAHYFSVGASALRSIELAMSATAKRDVKSVLDLPCGHGRVLRHLKARFPEAKLTACDLDRDGVDFCASRFGAVPVYSMEQPELIRIDDTFDLVWCGSLLTHLAPKRWEGFLRLFTSVLQPGGLLVFTTLGRLPAEWIRRGLATYGLSSDKLPGLLADYGRDGVAYADYPHAPGYGISLSSPAWVSAQVERFPALRLVLYSEAAWDDHQDIIACVGLDGPLAEAQYVTAGRHQDVLRILREISR